MLPVTVDGVKLIAYFSALYQWKVVVVGGIGSFRIRQVQVRERSRVVRGRREGELSQLLPTRLAGRVVIVPHRGYRQRAGTYRRSGPTGRVHARLCQ